MNRTIYQVLSGFLLSLMICSTAVSATLTIPMYFTSESGLGQKVGTVTASDSQYGLMLTPDLQDLQPGLHGFHIHQKPNCAMMGSAAGGHYDPEDTGKHLGPYDNAGHKGDLPALYVDASGHANQTILAPRLKVSDLYGHALMIHLHGDNYSDSPEKLGGGGSRMVCGVIAAN